MIPSYVFDRAIDGGFEQWIDSSEWQKAALDPKFWEALSLRRYQAADFLSRVLLGYSDRDISTWWKKTLRIK